MHAKCVHCGGTSCTCYDTNEEYEQAAREQAEWEADRKRCPLCDTLLIALELAHQYITNGIAFGYIRPPEPPDTGADLPVRLAEVIRKARGG